MGVDLIYYNMSRGSMILVQYKRLDAAKNGFYCPDSDRNLASEIERMQRVDRYVASHRNAHDGFRMEPSPCWIKLCHPRRTFPQIADMIYGMPGPGCASTVIISLAPTSWPRRSASLKSARSKGEKGLIAEDRQRDDSFLPAPALRGQPGEEFAERGQANSATATPAVT